MRAITLAIIVRVVFGIEEAQRAAALRELIPGLLPDSALSSLVLLPALHRNLGPRSPWMRFLAARDAVDALLYEEIARRADPRLADRTDVLSLLLGARDEEGAPLTDRELRDELMTLLLAGHETTATALAWTFELLHRHPEACARARTEARVAGPDGPTPWLDAVAAETLRLKPPLPLAAYAWLPFGGGIRRCVGAAFAQLELRAVLRTVLAAADLHPADARPERTRRRAIVLTPSRGARTVVVSRG